MFSLQFSAKIFLKSLTVSDKILMESLGFEICHCTGWQKNCLNQSSNSERAPKWIDPLHCFILEAWHCPSFTDSALTLLTTARMNGLAEFPPLG
jgi:hypothetical protein